MPFAKVKDDKVTIPKKLRVKLGIEDGDTLDFDLQGTTILIQKVEGIEEEIIEEDDGSFLLTPKWQEMEREADKDIAEGRLSPAFDTAKEAIKYLRRQSRKLRKQQ